jgi:uncharacterized membrane protein
MPSLRLKLTVYYLAILSAVLLLFGVAIFFYLSRSLVATIDQALAFQVEKIEIGMAVGAGQDLSEHPLMQNQAAQEDFLPLVPYIVQIINEQGQITDPGAESQKAQRRAASRRARAADCHQRIAEDGS